MVRICWRVAAPILFMCLLVLGSAAPGFGQTERGWKRAWSISVVVVVGANALDAGSSIGRYEANPLLRNSAGRFSPGRGVAVKAAASGGMLLVQYLLRRRMPNARLEKPATIANFSAAAAIGATAYRNTRN